MVHTSNAANEFCRPHRDYARDPKLKEMPPRAHPQALRAKSSRRCITLTRSSYVELEESIVSGRRKWPPLAHARRGRVAMTVSV
ncbi:hypothetical protein EVAR_80399_1 [Eumeta japonica]|uniref:Uncharacterized protein n=1 Tax=Eumeta variegata TaxID=151549 RepID=A0A4C1VGR7_EUMVA|nr:hypothetical protein EVAR_80399_1 [Eumeta japonica]